MPALCSYLLTQFVYILQAVSQKDAPHNNYFLYDPETNAGVVEPIHSKSFLPPKAKVESEVIEELIL